jgi:hypothetical protein
MTGRLVRWGRRPHPVLPVRGRRPPLPPGPPPGLRPAPDRRHTGWKRACDDYFHLPHRGEARGIGGLFFDHLTDDLEAVWEFQRDLADHLLDAYLPILERRIDTPYGPEQVSPGTSCGVVATSSSTWCGTEAPGSASRPGDGPSRSSARCHRRALGVRPPSRSRDTRGRAPRPGDADRPGTGLRLAVGTSCTASASPYPSTPGEVRATSPPPCVGMPSETQRTFVLAPACGSRWPSPGTVDTASTRSTRCSGIRPCLDHGVIRSGEAAIAHLFRVAAGLESPIWANARSSPSSARRWQTPRNGVGDRPDGEAAGDGGVGGPPGPRAPARLTARLDGGVAAQVVGGADRVAVLGSGLMAQAVVMGLLGLPAPPDDHRGGPNAGERRHPRGHGVAMTGCIGGHRNVSGGGVGHLRQTAPHPRGRTGRGARRRAAALTLVDMAMPPDSSLRRGSGGPLRRHRRAGRQGRSPSTGRRRRRHGHAAAPRPTVASSTTTPSAPSSEGSCVRPTRSWTAPSTASVGRPGR